LDTSALLAILNGEPGGESFTTKPGLLENAVMSSVNIAEAYGKLVGRGIAPDDAWEAVTGPIPQIVDFDTDQARIAGGLLPQTRNLGLSLGDRACLALGIALEAPIYTADRAWKELKLKVSINVIR
jgi:PIN domain nuclease of toxin-antitoxin system